MIRSEQDDGVVQQLFLAQRPDDQPQLMVDMGAERVKGASDRGDLRGVVFVAPNAFRRDRIGQVLHPAPVIAQGQVDVAIAIHVEIGLQWHQRRVRMAIGQIPEARAGRIAALDLADHLLGRPVGDMQVFAQVPRAVDIAVRAHPVVELLARMALVAQPDFVIIHHAILGAAFFVQLHVVKADPVALGKDMQLADRLRLIAGGGKGCGQSVARHRKLVVIDAVAMPPRRGAGHQRTARRHADRTFAGRVDETGAIAAQFVQRRGLDHRMARRPQQMPRPLIDGDQQDVRPVGCHQRSPRLICSRSCRKVSVLAKPRSMWSRISAIIASRSSPCASST